MKRNKPKRILSVVGARPQFIKLARLAPELNRLDLRHSIIHTGQHYDTRMSSLFFSELDIPKSTVNLKIGGGSHGRMTGRMLIALEKQFESRRPDLVLVYGDTNSTLAGALAAAKLAIPVGHVEAGLRSFVESMPEEINRSLTDRLARLNFCPTAQSIRNLRKEGIADGILHCGDLMYELLHDSRKAINSNQKFLRRHDLTRGKFLYLTVHRAETVDNHENLMKLIDVMAGLEQTLMFPLHPRTRSRLRQFKMERTLAAMPNVKLVEPLGYLDSLTAAASASHVLTDSGGLQKEALFLGTQVLTLREETEWTETVGRGNRLVGLSRTKIIRALSKPTKVVRPEWQVNGRRPSKLIGNAIKKFLSQS